ncbi:MAG: hypothetical protein ABFD49_05395 [Armatimonadota bacterium]|nr:hypothetical protein [bacterium]
MLKKLLKTAPLSVFLFLYSWSYAVCGNDAYVKSEGTRWTFGTSQVERTVTLENGKFLLKNFVNKASGRHLLPIGNVSPEFCLSYNNEALSGASGNWEFVDFKKTRLNQGELQLDITIRRGSLQATKSYVIYPVTSIIREWVSFKNVGSEPFEVMDPSFLVFRIRPGDNSTPTFHWMTGGENRPGSWMLKTEQLTSSVVRGFDSYDPFPSGESVVATKKYRPGSMSYAPWYALCDEQSGQGLFIGWDYFGHWKSSFEMDKTGVISVNLGLSGHKQTLNSGESITTPKAFIGLYRGDLDNAGNQCLDWQYRYMWDYTRDRWFPGIRMLGYWYAGTQWGSNWSGGNGDFRSCFLKVFRLADLIRYVGADVYHRDWGWWDKAGDWNGPDWRATGDYLGKSDIGQLIYAFVYHAEPGSKIANEHPDWLIRDTFATNLVMLCDLSRPDVVEGLGKVLDRFATDWGAYEWRNDSVFAGPIDGDDTVLLAQDQGMRKLTEGFLDRNPDCAFQAVNFGGTYAGYDYVRYASCISFSDGGVGALRNYYGSLLFPPDKTSDIPDVWQPDSYDKATWRGLLCMNFDMTGDTIDPAKLEGVRELIDIYHYLQKNGVVGRWVKVYRPIITGDDPTMYFQRLSGDCKRGIIIPKRLAPSAVTIQPKGLLPNQTYIVSFQESEATQKRTGADLMANGVKIEKMLPGELIYLNLPMHPGSKLDKEPPVAPSNVVKSAGENMGFPGVDLRWKPSKDNNWVSYYQIIRDGVVIDKVSKGSYYFDHSAGADAASLYEVVAVDGAGNISVKAKASGVAVSRSDIYDDADSNFMFTGSWQHEKDQLPAHAKTVSSSNEKGAIVEIKFSGKQVLLFVNLGPDCGKAAISIDGGPAEVVDTYSADTLWGTCLFRKNLDSDGPHIMRLEVLDERSEKSKDTYIRLDGIRIEH